MNSGNGEEPSTTGTWEAKRLDGGENEGLGTPDWKWGLCPEGMGNASQLRREDFGEAGCARQCKGSWTVAQGTHQEALLYPGSLTLSLLLQQGRFHAPAHTYTNSRTDASIRGALTRAFIQSVNQQIDWHMVFTECLPYARHYSKHW